MANKKVAVLKTMPVAYVDIEYGDPVILFHGFSFSVFEWKDVAPVFSGKFRVTTPELVGLGNTHAYSQAALNFLCNGDVANEARITLAASETAAISIANGTK